MRAFAAFATAIVAVVAFTSSSSNAEPAGQTLFVSAITCPDAMYFHTEPKAMLLDDAGNKTPVAVTQASPGFYTGTAAVQPSHYELYAKDGFCDGGLSLTILPNHDRHVGLVLVQGHRTIWDYDSSIAAALPISVSGAALLQKNGAETPLIIDAGALYGEHFHTGDYTLRLDFFQQGFESRVPVSLKRGVNVVQLGAADIQRNMGYVVKYPLKPGVFQRLWPANEIR
jgi:hypothetical protein